jgi:hypothetical protein
LVNRAAVFVLAKAVGGPYEEFFLASCKPTFHVLVGHKLPLCFILVGHHGHLASFYTP